MQAWSSKKGNLYAWLKDTGKPESAPFASQKEAAAPKIESVLKSKAVRTTLAFAKGFAIGFVAPYLLYDRTHGNFEMVQMPAAIVIGGLNAIRTIYGDKEQNQKDNIAFLKGGVTAAIVTSAVFSMPYVILGSGTVFGALSVAYHRYVDWKRKKKE